MNEQDSQRHSGEEAYYGDYRGKITPPPFKKPIFVLSVLLAVTVIIAASLGVIAFHFATSQPDVAPTATTKSPLTSQPTSQSTETPTSQPTSIPSPTLSGLQTIPENIRLRCNCSDPVVVTITQIVIQPQQNRMLWSLTLSNTSQSNASASFNQISLQEGDQIHNPASGGQIYKPTGPLIDSALPLQPGNSQSVIITFSFVPYIHTFYTLVSELFDGITQGVTFDPVLVQF